GRPRRQRPAPTPEARPRAGISSWEETSTKWSIGLLSPQHSWSRPTWTRGLLHSVFGLFVSPGAVGPHARTTLEIGDGIDVESTGAVSRPEWYTLPLP